MASENARRDQNSVPTLLGVSSSDGVSLVDIWVDPITHRVLTDATGGGGTGTVTSVSVVTANGVSGSVATATTTPAITLALGAITPTSVAASGTVTGSNLSGTNTGDQTSVTGNAGTATALQNARTINGVSFDGTANINVPTEWRVISQTAHGFAVGDVIYLVGATYTKAIASSSAAAEVVGMVSTVTNANAFIMTIDGLVTGLSGFTAGTVYFLSPTSAGTITATEPSTVGQVSKPVLTADSTTSGYFSHSYRGAVIASSGGTGITRSVSSISSPATAGATALIDYVYLVSGTTTLTLPTAVGNTNLYTVKNVGSNTVTVATTSAQTIDGSSTASLPVANTSIDLISNNSNWNVI